MRIDAAQLKKLGQQGRMIDVFRADTGEHLKWVRWFDVDAGLACVFRIDPAIAEAGKIPPDNVSRLIRAPIRFVESRPAPRYGRLAKGEPIPAELARQRTTFERCVAIQGRECCYPGCHDLAVLRTQEDRKIAPKTFHTMDVQEVPPESGPDGELFQRVIVTGARYFCSRPSHYLAPTFTSLRGVEREVLVELARP
jgi:hypothetical protein